MSGVLSIEDNAKVVARNEGFQSEVAVSKWWRRVKGINEPLNSKLLTIFIENY